MAASPASRVGDYALGHGAYPPSPATVGSPNVFTVSSPQLRLGDAIMVHCAPAPPACHGRMSAQGSSTVFTNSKPTTRIGDKVSCGGALVQGVPNVIIGG